MWVVCEREWREERNSLLFTLIASRAEPVVAATQCKEILYIEKFMLSFSLH